MHFVIIGGGDGVQLLGGGDIYPHPPPFRHRWAKQYLFYTEV